MRTACKVHSCRLRGGAYCARKVYLVGAYLLDRLRAQKQHCKIEHMRRRERRGRLSMPASFSTIYVLVLIIIVVFSLFLLEHNGILDSNKVEFYKFVGLFGGSVLLIYNAHLLRCRIIIEEDRKEIQEKSRLDERFKVGVEFLKKEDTSVAGVHIIYETYKLDEDQYGNIIYDIFKGVIDKGKDKNAMNIVLKLLATQKSGVNNNEESRRKIKI